MTTAADVVRIADSFVGQIHEDPPGSNCTPIGVEFGFNCVEWCAEYVSVCLARAGQPAFHTASVADSIAQAQAGTNGMLWLPAHGDIAAGDVANFDFGGHGNPADFHDSIVRDPMTQDHFQTDGGNESNQVLQRVVDRTFATGFIRPAYAGGGGGGGGTTGPVQGVISAGLTAVQLSGFEAEFFVFQALGQGTGGGGGGTGPGGSGTISYAEIEGYWIAAGGDPAMAAIMAAITGAESSFQPGEIQQGEPYGTTGWGLWQITPGNSYAGDPAVGQDYQLLDPLRNARAAVHKLHDQGLHAWTTYTHGTYLHFMQTGVTPAQVGDPGQFIPIGSAPSGTHNTSMPGSTA